MSAFGDGQTRLGPTPVLHVKIQRGSANQTEFTFSKPFYIGREEPCEILLQDRSISRRHAEVYIREGCWWIRDLNSANGTYVDGKKIDRLPLARPTLIEFGLEGPILFFEEEKLSGKEPTLQDQPASVTQYVKRYFDKSPEENMGQHTMFLRQAFLRIQKKQKSKYGLIIAGIAVLLIITAAYAILQQRTIRELRKSAVDIFYQSKASELRIADLTAKLMEADKIPDLKEVQSEKNSLNERRTDYDKLIEKLGIYKKNMNPDERLIMKVAYVFGECELNLPSGFIQEVRRYIKEWQTTSKLANAIARAKKNRYDLAIGRELARQKLPLQFFYIALQESEFDTKAYSPPTSYGFAKGMWMFIPSTAKDYDLHVGPLVGDPVYDPKDERHDFDKSTLAAARYLRRIYDTDAQASGLLVVASYNWGENRVIGLIRQMATGPKERNFWRFLDKYFKKIPDETYNYVFRIFSAAVIGENPKLFEFDFEDPLVEAKALYSQ
jgi:pSer/pThr/pTyr-binding forkhead associated (FHA) protein/soluble lytic murein transglycosylase-like protein